tara:strand:- start:231 stop:692 length:462 start_codon:yes stop_codon:yes gene_type:complete
MNHVNYSLVSKNIKYGISKEVQWRKLLSKKYPSIIDNNKENKFSSMDSISNDNGIIIEHEHKSRKRLKYNQYRGLMLNACKIHKGIKKIQSGVRQIFYWTLEDDNKDMYYWELTDLEKQQDEIVFYRNGNFITNEGYRDVVDIKWEYLKKYED